MGKILLQTITSSVDAVHKFKRQKNCLAKVGSEYLPKNILLKLLAADMFEAYRATNGNI
jgi:hypothetical protein